MKPKHKSGRIILGVIIVLGLVAMYLVISYLMASQQINAASKVSTGFVEDLKSNDTSDAYKLTSPFFQQNTAQSQLNDYGAAIGSKVRAIGAPNLNKSGQIGPFKSLKEVVIVYPVTGIFKQGTLTVNLEKVSGSWLVKAFSIDIPN